MAWWTAIFGIADKSLELVNKWVPSREEKAGAAMAERKQLKETADAKKRMEDVKPSDESDTVDRLRDGEF